MNFQTTGDPFIDAGRLAAQAVFRYQKLRSPTTENWLKAIDFAVTQYQKHWQSKIDAVSLNGWVSHNANKKKARSVALKGFQDLFTRAEAGEGDASGWCRGCGQSKALFTAGRELLPLSGSGAFLNFHHAHETGVQLCAECQAALFMVPLAIMQCGKNLALLQTQTEALQDFWLKTTVEQNLKNLARGNSEGILRYTYGNIRNAFFALVNDLITENYAAERQLEPQDLRLFYFTNFGAKPESEIYDLPASAFTFLWIVQDPTHPAIKSAWHRFVRRHYRIKDAEYDESTNIWTKTKGKSQGELPDEDFKNNRNAIHDALLFGRNLLPRFYRRRERKSLVPLEIVKAYILEVRFMKKERIDAVLRLADRVSDLVQKENAPKLIYPVESARFVYQFRAALLRLLKKSIAAGEETPLFTTEDYLTKLLPDGEPWTDVRDLLLIRIYEKLHTFLQGEAETIDEETVAIPVGDDDDDSF